MKRRNKILLTLASLMSAALLQPTALPACTTCYGANNSDSLVQGMGWGIFALLCTITCVLAGIAMFFVHVIRREAALTAPGTEALATPKN